MSSPSAWALGCAMLTQIEEILALHRRNVKATAKFSLQLVRIPFPGSWTWRWFLPQSLQPRMGLSTWRLDSPDLHCIFHHRHVRLTLCWRVDGQFGWWDHKALAEGQPHALAQGVGESAGTATTRALGHGYHRPWEDLASIASKLPSQPPQKG